MKYPKLISVSTDKNFFLFLKYDNGENKKYDFSPNEEAHHGHYA